MSTTWSAEDRDAVYERVRSVARLPGVEVAEANGHLGLSVRGRRFGWLMADHHDDGRLALCVKAPPGEQDALLGRGGFFLPAYLGSRGWVGSTSPRGPAPTGTRWRRSSSRPGG